MTSKVNQGVSGLIMLYTQAITNALDGAGRRSVNERVKNKYVATCRAAEDREWRV